MFLMHLKGQPNNTRYKFIAISVENYIALKKLGEMGSSFNDVITNLLKGVK